MLTFSKSKRWGTFKDWLEPNAFGAHTVRTAFKIMKSTILVKLKNAILYTKRICLFSAFIQIKGQVTPYWAGCYHAIFLISYIIWRQSALLNYDLCPHSFQKKKNDNLIFVARILFRNADVRNFVFSHSSFYSLSRKSISLNFEFKNTNYNQVSWSTNLKVFHIKKGLFINKQGKNYTKNKSCFLKNRVNKIKHVIARAIVA